MSEVFEQVMAQCAGGSFTGLLRVQTRGGRGEIRFLSGIQDEIRFDGLLGDAALERLQAADEAEFEAIQSLPPLDPGGSAPVPIEGALERIHAAQLMRYCEANSLTCALELEVKGAVLTARYRLGELLSVEPDSELTAQLAEAKQGAYRFRLPRFELAASAPRASNGSAPALHAPVPVATAQIRTSANAAQPATPALRATPQSRPTPAATPAARNLHAAPTPVSTPAPKIAPVAPLPVGNSGSAKTGRTPAATPVAAPLAGAASSNGARPAARAGSPTPVATGTRPMTTTARPGAAIQAKPVTSVGASPAAPAKARADVAKPAAGSAQPAEPVSGGEPAAAAVRAEPAAPRAEAAARPATTPGTEAVAGRGPRERAEQITARSTPQRTPAAPPAAARTARANGEDAAAVAASVREVAKPARTREAPRAEQSSPRPWLVLAVLIALAVAGWMAFGSPLPGR